MLSRHLDYAYSFIPFRVYSLIQKIQDTPSLDHSLSLSNIIMRTY